MTKYNQNEIDKRRCFGIISHPDAGKTTLTEKLLLFGGAINIAGAIKSRKASRYATSDWMKIEQERGISVTTSVMKFHYNNHELNLLDTPGHQDFSEDTYRVLTAVDSALMVIDSTKGVETQTEKLMSVCRMRNTPIITFINKLDREGRHPLDLLQEIEDKLQIECAPITWPTSSGKSFKGVYNLERQHLCLYNREDNSLTKDPVTIKNLSDKIIDDLLQEQAEKLREDIELLEGAANSFSQNDYLKGNQTPVFFGSALNNFGIQELLEYFIEISPPPQARPTINRLVSPYEKHFSGFAFKIQANMDPAHRDRIAFIRICSGKFTKGMKVVHHRLKKEICLNNATMFMSQDRKNIETAFPGDIIGIHNKGTIKIGDSFTTKEPLTFTGIPNFAPEIFKSVILKSPLKSKQLHKGLTQLSEEGTVQVFKPLTSNTYILGAVGSLQFDVTQSRLEQEYSVDAQYNTANYCTARWISCNNKIKLENFISRYKNFLATDSSGALTFLAPDLWQLKHIIKEWPDIQFNETREQNIQL